MSRRSGGGGAPSRGRADPCPAVGSTRCALASGPSVPRAVAADRQPSRSCPTPSFVSGRRQKGAKLRWI